MTEDDAKKVLRSHGMCGFISDSTLEGTPFTVRVGCILPRHHDGDLHEPPVMVEIPRPLLIEALAALHHFMEGDLSELSEGRGLNAKEREAWERASTTRSSLRARLSSLINE